MSGAGTQQLTAKQCQDIKRAFQVFDKNKDGKLSRSELGEVLACAGLKMSSSELKSFMEKVDTNKNGSVDYDEFCGLMKDLVAGGDAVMEAKTREAFKAFDMNGDGKITKDELSKAMSNMGSELCEQELDSLIKTIDRDGDGQINYEEFVTMIYIFQVGVCKQ